MSSAASHFVKELDVLRCLKLIHILFKGLFCQFVACGDLDAASCWRSCSDYKSKEEHKEITRPRQADRRRERLL